MGNLFFSENENLDNESNLLNKPTIVVVDDDLLILEALKLTFSQKYEVIPCSNGNEAIEKISPSVSAVILDIKMEGKNGFETFTEIKKTHTYLPIIFHSAYQDIKNPFEIMNEYRPFGYIIKDGEIKTLLDTTESAVNYFYQINKNNILVKELEKSEEKYRDLVENSLDIIFSLDSNGHILSINQSVSRILRYSPEELINKKFSELEYKTNSLTGILIQKHFQELSDTNNIVSFNCDLVSKFGEPKEMNLKFQYFKKEENFIVFGSASNIEEDLLIRLCDSENQIYIIGNYLNHVEIISNRLSSSTSKYCNAEIVMNLRMAMRELLINAMEHGNLGISFEEKTHSLNNGSYLPLLIERQKDSKNILKKITVESSLSSKGIKVRITDEGDGFDVPKMLSRSLKDSEYLSHGRGIIISKDFLDTVQYNSKGNSVYFEKFFNTT